jgi:hypothetical protein
MSKMSLSSKVLFPLLLLPHLHLLPLLPLLAFTAFFFALSRDRRVLSLPLSRSSLVLAADSTVTTP